MGTLLQEDVSDLRYITEGTDSKKLYIEGICLQSNIPNRNNRIYPESILEREIDKYNKNFIAENRAVGELSHPNCPTVNLDKISHKIISLVKEGSDFIGKALIIEDTPMGKIAGALIRNGVKLGASSRGVGSLKENSQGLNEVQEDFQLLVAYDIVYDPSAPKAFQQGIMENAEWIYEASSGCWKKADKIKQKMKKMNHRELEENTLKLMKDFLESL